MRLIAAPRGTSSTSGLPLFICCCVSRLAPIKGGRNILAPPNRGNFSSMAGALALALAGCASHLQTVDQQLTTALASEPVAISTQETSSGVSGSFHQSGVITLTSSADYLYPPVGMNCVPARPCFRPAG
jgi:hypothetical protein